MNKGTSSSKSGSGRGFAAMNPERHREIARQGGRASQRSDQGNEGGQSSLRTAKSTKTHKRADDDITQSNGGRGFASMDPERQREIASKGGRAAHASGHAHEWSSAEAVEAGHKGGTAQRDDDDNSRRSGGSRDVQSHSQPHSGRDYEGDDRGHSSSHGRNQSRSYRDDDDRGGRGRQRFASADPERQREIAREGGRSSHRDDYDDDRWRGERSHSARSNRDYDDDDRSNRGRSQSYSNRDNDDDRGSQGFASMDPERRREIAREGGRSSHRNDYDDDRWRGERSHSARSNRDYDDDDRGGRDDYGFASTDRERQRDDSRQRGRAAPRNDRDDEYTSQSGRGRGSQDRGHRENDYIDDRGSRSGGGSSRP